MARVLVVDDDKSIAAILQSVLEDDGHQVLAASNGSEALVLLPRFRPAVVVSDVVMPIMGGLELARAINADPALDFTKVVLMSALTRPPTDGVYQAFIPKPFDVDDILVLVARLTSEP